MISFRQPSQGGIVASTLQGLRAYPKTVGNRGKPGGANGFRIDSKTYIKAILDVLRVALT